MLRSGGELKMNAARKYITWVIIIIFTISSSSITTVKASESSKGKRLPILSKARELQHSINTKTRHKPKKSLNSINRSIDYSDSKNYPLINNNYNVDKLTDSYGTTHTINYLETIEYSANDMKVRIQSRCSEPYYKDAITSIEFWRENESGKVEYLDTVEFDLWGYTNANLGSIIPKSLYDAKGYIYIRVGLSESSFDLYYSDLTAFKVANPFYTASPVNPPSNGEKGKYVVISNESLDSQTTQYTGSFSVSNNKFTINKSLDHEAYKIDVNIPFNSKKYKNKALNILNKEFNVVEKNYNVGENKHFNVINFVSCQYEMINATLLYSGTVANVWVNNNQISSQDAQKLGLEFDTNIYKSVVENFGKESDVNQDGKINILCYDIKDGFSGYGGYIGGYFDTNDLYNAANSNKCEIFYIDTYPSMGLSSTKDVSEAYSTLAHEFQHMVNHNQNIFVEGAANNMEPWLDEALSMAAEQIYLKTALSSRISYYNTSNAIRKGHSLLYWDYNGDVLSNYALSYLFGQYIKVQAAKGDKIFKEILQGKNNSYKDVEDIIHKYIHSTMSFTRFMTHFRAALTLKESSGLNGFKGDPAYNQIQTLMYNGTGTNLRGGGAIVKDISTSGIVIPSNKGGNITYTILGANKSVPVKGVKLNKSKLDLKLGKTFKLTASITPTNATNKNVTWVSSNPKVATVDANGVVTSKRVGKAVITVKTKDGGYKASCTVNVKANP